VFTLLLNFFNPHSWIPMDSSARHLVFHGSIVLLFGLLCGAPYGRAIHRNAPTHIIHSWRVAHASLPIGAMLMFAVAALLSSFAVAAQIKWFMAIALIVSAYAFCFSLPLAAMTGHRGLSSGSSLTSRLIFRATCLARWLRSQLRLRSCMQLTLLYKRTL
jgi:hypothetical protein